MKKFKVVPAMSTAVGGKKSGEASRETSARMYRIRDNRSLEVLPNLYDSEEQAQAECERREAE